MCILPILFSSLRCFFSCSQINKSTEFAQMMNDKSSKSESVYCSHLLFCLHFFYFSFMQAISYIRTLYAFTNETLAKYSYATSLQATLRYGILISLVQGLGLGFTYGLAICSCALQLWVGRFLISHGKANGGEIVTALFAVILSGL